MTNAAAMLGLCLALTLPVGGAPPDNPVLSDPRNAAYWYAKAYALYDDPNGTNRAAYARGATLTPEIEQFVLKQKPVLDCLAKAARSEYCNWGFDPLENLETVGPYLLHAGTLSTLLYADIQLTQERNPKRLALDTIETALRYARHIDSKDPLNHIISVSIRAHVYPHIFNAITHSATLTRDDFPALKTLLTDTIQSDYSVRDTIEYTINATRLVFENPSKYFSLSFPLLSYYDFLANRSADFYKRNYTFYEGHLLKIQKAFDSPYPEASQEITRLEGILAETLKDFRQRFPVLPKDGPFSHEDESYLETCDFLYAILFPTSFRYSYSIEIRTVTQTNALLAALDLLIEYPASKTLPDALPADSPLDLFSGKPFLLIQTETGFTLKCQGEDLSRNEICEYRFTLPEE